MASSLPETSPSAGRTETRPDSDLIFEKSVAKFKSRLSRSQAEQFAKCTIDDVRNQIRHIQNRHGSQRRLRNMDRLSKFVEGMVHLGKVVEVFLNLHNGVALIWGPIKFLLLAASNWIDSLDSLLAVYSQIGEVLPDLTRYGQIYKEYPYVHTHLESYYCDILEFHSNALDVFARPGWKVLFHSAWKTFKTKFDPILKSLERHRIMLSEERLTAVMEETQKQGHSIQDKLDQLNRQLQERDQKNAERDLTAHQSRIDQQYSTVESRIDAPNYHEDYEIASQKRFQNTSGRWILSHPRVSEWLDHSSKANGKIYLSGIPGAGKTVLASSIINHLKERRSSGKGSADNFSISYFYFKHHQRKKSSLLSLLLALLAQLVAQDETLLDHVYQACRSADPQQFRSLDEVSRHVSTALQSQSRCFVIIDGLDECAEASRVLNWFESTMSKQDDTSRDTDFNIRLFISGQRDGILEGQMSHYTRIDLETSSGHDRDIETFAKTMAIKIRERFSLDPGVEQDIALRVTSKAGGMFLYAQLVLNNLFSQTSKYDLKQELKAKTFPEGLEQASLVDVSYLDPSVSSPGEEVIDLVHTTAKIYLVQTKEIDLQIENAKMALFCTEYMISPPLASGLPKLEIQDYAFKGYYGFHDYAVAFWWKHIQQVVAASELDTELARKVLQIADRYVTDTGEIEQIEAFDDSSREIQSIRRKLEGIPQNLRDWNFMRIYEMRADAVRDAIQELINQPYKQKKATLALYGPWRYKCRKPWCQFFSRGFADAQQQQIHINQHELPFTCEYQGCHATEVGFGTETDLRTHARRWHPKEEPSLFPAPKRHTPNHSDILRTVRMGDLNKVKNLIEQAKISPDYQKEGGKSLLELAVQSGHLHIVQYLTEMGANVNVKVRQTRSLLDVAVASRDLEIVTFLCSLNSIPVDEGKPDNNTLAVCAMLDPFPQAIMAQLLRTASPECSQELLLFAIKSKNATAVAYLAEALDASCFDSALEVAATIAHLPCLDALLSSGKTDPNAHDVDGGLPLHAACASGALPIVQRLYAVTTTSHKYVSGNTPLHVASRGGHVAVVEFLIRKGEDINASNKDLETPLEFAIRNGETAVRKLLLENGARLDTVDESDGALPDAGRVVGMDNSLEPWFEGGTGLANPLTSAGSMDEFDFDAFLEKYDGEDNSFNFPEAFPMAHDIPE
ncbi:zinc finger protein [Fusarium globosum]|uniref:Zinc finger protein n=1 Tax=Fusarium globosum TaxID=78864 RepID=A0A8H6CY03_9HYPO|nr:zinc finger protein [Fusarium globosum]